MLLTNNDVYKRDRQTSNFKAIHHRWCARETDKHVILKLTSTDGVQERQTNM